MNQMKEKQLFCYKVMFAMLALIAALLIALLNPAKTMAAPAAVTDIKIAGYDNAKRTYALTWKADSTVVLYALELYGSDTNKCIAVKKFAAADFNKTKTYALTLPAGTPVFHVRILAQDKTGATSASALTRLTTNAKVKKPGALSVVTADFEKGKYKLAWNPDGEAGKYILEVYNTKASEDLIYIQKYDATKVNVAAGIDVTLPASNKNKSFVFRVIAIDKAGADSEWSDMKMVCPTAKVLGAKNLGNNKIEVRWLGVVGAKRYNVFCKISNGKYKKISRSSSAKRTKIIKGMKNGKYVSIIVVPELAYKGVTYNKELASYMTPYKFKYKKTTKRWSND